ncbi:hypothetical protein ACO0QE_003141 [Hanseniaspora vineae]
MSKPYYSKNNSSTAVCQFKKELVEQCLDLIEQNDHNALAYLARTCGIPPNLRFIVWPILLKYHPLVIAPNIMSNTLQFNINYEESNTTSSSKSTKENTKSTNKNTKKKHKVSAKNAEEGCYTSDEETEDITWEYHKEENTDDEIKELIKLDVAKYFMVKYDNLEFDENVITSSILKFLHKWGKIFKYENGLTWACLSLCEWVSPVFDPESNEVLVLPGRSFHRNNVHTGHSLETNASAISDPQAHKASTPSANTAFNQNGKSDEADHHQKHHHHHHHKHNHRHHTIQNNDIYIDLLKEYPLSKELQERVQKIRNLHSERTCHLKFSDLYERLMLVILHSPDIKTIVENKKSKHNTLYTPLISGGDFNYNHSVFYKIFEACLNELYQPFTDQLINTRNKWLYYWLKFSSVRSFHKVDRGRFWDMLLGWRPNPDNLLFYLKYNNKYSYGHFYSSNVPASWTVKNENRADLVKQEEKIDQQGRDADNEASSEQEHVKKSQTNGKDPPQKGMSFLDKLFKYCNNNEDYFWFPDLANMKLNKDDPDIKIFQELMKKNSLNLEENGENKDNVSKLHNVKGSEPHHEKNSLKFPYSILDIHTQQLFIYLSILQKNEFKLLEFEEAEIVEFLNNVPILGKNDDSMYKNLFTSSHHSRGSESEHLTASPHGNPFSSPPAAEALSSNYFPTTLSSVLGRQLHPSSSHSKASSTDDYFGELSDVDSIDFPNTTEASFYSASTGTPTGLPTLSALKSQSQSQQHFGDHSLCLPKNTPNHNANSSSDNSKKSNTEDSIIPEENASYKDVSKEDEEAVSMQHHHFHQSNMFFSPPPTLPSSPQTLPLSPVSSVATLPLTATTSNLTRSGTAATTSGPSKNRIEMGTDDKLLLSFNEILITAGDIWRKWLWSELEQNSY